MMETFEMSENFRQETVYKTVCIYALLKHYLFPFCDVLYFI